MHVHLDGGAPMASDTRPPAPNRLAQETSPYLLQHADNPVDWYPWGEEALTHARDTDKPILLSIGYSSCHWCHVMAHESFEDADVASVMNEHFVNVKVDREERPDLDKIYQLAHQLLTQSTGGWPLTMFLDPQNLIPFFGGTYFPKTSRHQLPGFIDLLRRIAQVYTEQREALTEQAEKFTTIFEQIQQIEPVAGTIADDELLAAARRALLEQYDPVSGGFGEAPKFPMPSMLERLLRHWAYANRARERGDREAIDAVMHTLTRMARGGIFDHLRGGFCRYATDADWMIPHFEKMLYDNGALLALYADALAVGPDSLFEQTVRATAEWLSEDMQHPGGGYFAALDADSEGVEGKYYVWRRDDVRRLLSEDEYLVVETLFGLDKPPNFEGKWNLHRYDAWHSVVDRLSLERDDADRLLASAKAKLLIARRQRIPPGLDDKILVSWNGLAVKGMAKAAIQLNEPAWLESATRALDFIRTEMTKGDRLFATWRDGIAKHNAYLDDYANLLEAVLILLSARWREQDIRFARLLADMALADYHDAAQGGFYFTPHHHEALIVRPKPTMDDSMPPGNGTLAIALNRLGHLLGETRYIDAAAATLRWARQAMEQYPSAHCTMLHALEEQLYPQELVLIRGPEDAAREWQARCRTGYKPWRQSFVIPYDAAGPVPDYLPKLVSADMRRQPVAYVCQGLSCSLPIRSLDALIEKLDS
jgi:uncharacterized protein